MGGRFTKRIYYGLMALFFGMVFILAGCGAESGGNTANYSAAGSADSADYGEADAAFESQSANIQNLGHSDADDAGSDDGSSTAGVSSTQESPGFGANQDDQLAINRKLIYRANVTMEVEDFGAVQSNIRDLIQLSGGYLLEFSETNSEYERGGTFVIKVPSSGFMTFLTRLEEFSPDKYQSSITGQDVTEEYVDLEARLTAQQVTEQRLIAFMEQATRADDLVEFSRELGRVQQEIEQIKGRMRYLEQNVAYSTIEARIYERSEAANRLQQNEDAPFGERLSSSLQAVLNGISIVLQELVIFIVAALPVIIVLGIFAAPFYVWYRHRMRNRPEPRVIFPQDTGAAQLQGSGPGSGYESGGSDELNGSNESNESNQSAKSDESNESNQSTKSESNESNRTNESQKSNESNESGQSSNKSDGSDETDDADRGDGSGKG